MRCFLVILTLLWSESCQAFQQHGWTRPSRGRLPVLEASSQRDDNKHTTLPRLYVDASPQELARNVRLELDPDQAHYVTRVMRIDGKKKNLLRIFDGRSGEWLVQIDVEGKKRRGNVYATCLEQLRAQDETTSMDPWILWAPLKKARVKWMLEKCTELGATRFVPVLTKRTDPGSVRALAMDKLGLQLVEASEQSERLVPPILSNSLDDDNSDDDIATLKDLLASWETVNGDRLLLICRERSAAVPLLSLLGRLENNVSKVAFLIGPEGGWSSEEESLFDDCCKESNRIHAISLGSNVLRAETAAMTAIAAYAMYVDSAAE